MKSEVVKKTTCEDEDDAGTTKVVRRFVRQENFMKVEAKVTYPATESDGEILAERAKEFVEGVHFPQPPAGDPNQVDAFKPEPEEA